MIDAHNHLQDEWLKPHLPEIFRDLSSVGLVRAVVNGTAETDWDAVTALAKTHPWVLPSYGLHPWFLAARTKHWRECLTRLVDQRPCAIGEIGLDRWVPDFDIQSQKEVFTWQLALAAERNIPVTIHCLKAWGALWEIVSEYPVPARGFLLHAYGGPLEMVDGFVRLGAYFSFSGYFLNARKVSHRETFRHIPADRLLAETDAPAMPLPAKRNRFPLPNTAAGKPVNHPANIAAVYEGLAELRGWTAETLETQISANFERLFGGIIARTQKAD